ncbi:hypothetical protein JCM30237_23640 [Halolamina litorea]|uniref:Yip1 domain-containing protein n=1 Tax=Halolamina litorea TaxID=1515593 RepID=A0ABD6BV37_9EURY|nr:hypothetical protein [Halolamina litorea]
MSLKPYVEALLSPHEFGDWTPSLRAAIGAIVLLCVLNGASVAYAGDVITNEVSGTVTVDNPERPPDTFCEGSTFDYDGCDEPKTIEKPLRPAADGAVGRMAVKAVLAPIAWVALLGSLLVLGTGNAGGRDREAVDAFRRGALVASIAAIPGVLRYAVRPVVVSRGLPDWTYPNSIDGVEAAAVDALFPNEPAWAAIVLVSALWTAMVVFGGTRGVFETTDGLAGVVAAIAFVTVAASVPLTNGGWIGLPSLLGIFLTVVGVLGFLASGAYISVSKSFELIGFGGTEEVRPEPWYVGLHRFGAFVVVVAGYLATDGVALT